jgi:DNA-damage-inducible protein J
MAAIRPMILPNKECVIVYVFSNVDLFPNCGAILKNWRTFDMAKTEMIRARVEPDLKQDAEAVFSMLGMSPTEAITLFYKQVALQHGLPFEVRIPNAETLEAMRQTRERGGLVEYASVDELMAEFEDA